MTQQHKGEMEEELETAECSICGRQFERDINRIGGRLISCPAHSFGEVRPEDYESPIINN